MSKLVDAQQILRDLGLPNAQCNEMSAYVLLALCRVCESDRWSDAHRGKIGISKGIMVFIADAYGRSYAPNTRETIRKNVLHHFVQARVADYNPFSPDLPTNSPNAHYAVSQAALDAIRRYGTRKWQEAAARFVGQAGSLSAAYERRRARRLVPVLMPDGSRIELSPGRHSELQAEILDVFAPRFAPGSRLLYVADTVQKTHWADSASLSNLGISLSGHEKLPDIVLHDPERHWLFLIEAVTSHGPMTPKRVIELEEEFAPSGTGIVFVSAFPDSTSFGRFLSDVAWDTEVWIAEHPDHLVHFNGERFLGPRT